MFTNRNLIWCIHYHSFTRIWVRIRSNPIGHFEFQLMTMFYYSILRLRLKILFDLCHSIHFIFLVIIVTSSHPVTVSLFFSQHNGVVSPSTWLIVIFCFFWGFLIDHECDHSLGSLLTYELLFWAITLSPYTPPREPDSGLVLYSGDDALDGDWYCSDTAPLPPLLAAGGPPVKILPGSLYGSAVLIAPEDGNTLWASVRSQRWCPVVFFLGSLSIKAYMCCLPYVPNRVTLMRPMRDRGAVTMSLCRFLVFLRPVGRNRGRDISLSDIGSET